MVIRVNTLENLISDTSYFFGKEKDCFLQDIQGFNFESDDDSVYRYIVDNREEQLEEIYLCHIARKLDNDSNMSLRPLPEVLTTTNSFSDFLYKHGITFNILPQKGLELIYHGSVVAWHECRNAGFNPARFQKRLQGDFCVNGFQFLYDIANSAGADFNIYSRAPEFLQDLDFLLAAGLVNDFRSISHTAIALCRIPKEKIVFDGIAEDECFEEKYMYSVLEYIWEYCYSEIKRGRNHVLRGLDDSAIQVENWISEEEINIKM